MSDRTREQILELRAAYVRGVREVNHYTGNEAQWLGKMAADAYPLPKRTVPREVEFGGNTYRIHNGWLEYKGLATWCHVSAQGEIGVHCLTALLPIIQSPTMEVDDDEPQP